MTCHWVVGATSSCKESIGCYIWAVFEHLEVKNLSDRLGSEDNRDTVVLFSTFGEDPIKILKKQLGLF